MKNIKKAFDWLYLIMSLVMVIFVLSCIYMVNQKNLEYQELILKYNITNTVTPIK